MTKILNGTSVVDFVTRIGLVRNAYVGASAEGKPMLIELINTGLANGGAQDWTVRHGKPRQAFRSLRDIVHWTLNTFAVNLVSGSTTYASDVPGLVKTLDALLAGYEPGADVVGKGRKKSRVESTVSVDVAEATSTVAIKDSAVSGDAAGQKAPVETKLGDAPGSMDGDTVENEVEDGDTEENEGDGDSEDDEVEDDDSKGGVEGDDSKGGV
jgi:hypothetical protein